MFLPELINVPIELFIDWEKHLEIKELITFLFVFISFVKNIKPLELNFRQLLN